MRFDELLHENETIRITGHADLDVGGLTYRSQDVGSGWLFAAIPGSKVDGHDFIPKAIAAGARALIVENEPLDIPENVVTAVVKDSRRALAKAAGRFYGHPSRRMKLIGVTGTNGKTTTAFIIESILGRGGRKPAVIGTINYRFGKNVTPATVTTPESVDMQSMLARMIEMGADSAVVEVSSHALEQGRVWGMRFAARVFTNLSRDHLDYHGSMDKYFEAKSILFTDNEFAASGPAVVNSDDMWGKKLIAKIGPGVISYAIDDPEAMVKPLDWKTGPDGTYIRVKTPSWEGELKSPMMGRLNVYNVLASVAAAEAAGIEPEAVKDGVEALEKVPGRLEPVENSKGVTVLVDYSHTPDALEKAIVAVREFTTGKLFVVFGCGGDRDRGKRPIMGRLAARNADLALVTSDNPRTENPMSIISEILEGVKETGSEPIEAGVYPDGERNYRVEPDRRKAIMEAIRTSREGDSVLIAGKGHEDYQILGDKKIHFDDREVAREALGE